MNQVRKDEMRTLSRSVVSTLIKKVYRVRSTFVWLVGIALIAFVPKPAMAVATVTAFEDTPIMVTHPTSGTTVIDFGQEAAGYVEINPPASGSYTIKYGEQLNANGGVFDASAYNSGYWAVVAPDGAKIKNKNGDLVDVSKATIRRAIITGKSLTAGSWTAVKPTLSQLGYTDVSQCHWEYEKPASLNDVVNKVPFRYVEISGGNFTASNVRRKVYRYNFNLNAESFQSSNNNLNRVHDFCKNSVVWLSYLGVFVDGDRERKTYAGDMFAANLSSYTLDNDYMVAKESALACGNTWPHEWRMLYPGMMWNYILHSGDTTVASQRYATMQEYYNYFVAGAGATLTSDSLLDFSINASAATAYKPLVDWPKYYRYGYDFDATSHHKVVTVPNALFYKMCLWMSDIATKLGKTTDATTYANRAAAVKTGFNNVLFDGTKYKDQADSSNYSLHANVMALWAGLVPEDKVTGVFNYVKGLVQDNGMKCSAFFAQFLLDVLMQNGEAQMALDLMSATGENSWIRMMDYYNATTTLECWDLFGHTGGGEDCPDMTHAWATSPLNVISRYVLGVQPKTAGFASATINPQFGNMTQVSGTVPTAKGAVSVEYANGAVTVTIPSGMTADVEFAGETATLSGTTLSCTLPSSGHHHVMNSGEVTTPATCTTPGVKTYTCTAEGCTTPAYTTTETIPATGHDWSNWAAISTTQEQRTCSRCHIEETRLIPTGPTTNAMSNASWGYEIHGLGTSGNEVALVYTNAALNNMSFTAPSGVNSVQLLLVGGGGSGSANDYGSGGGGGGGGGVRYESNVSVSADTSYAVVVGKGGSSKSSPYSSVANGEAGESSSFGGSMYTANGGAGGSGATGGASGNGCSGAGSNGGPEYNGGGGGGASANGSVGYSKGGNGGAGVACSITGESLTYGGGGGGSGGAKNCAVGVGVDGGGDGGAGRLYPDGTEGLNVRANGSGQNGTDGLGGGGGGARYDGKGAASGAGGSGVVIVRYVEHNDVVKPDALSSETKTYAATDFKPTNVPTSSGYSIVYTKDGVTYAGAWKDAGTYKATLKLNSGIKWTDGTTADLDYYTLTINPLNLSTCTMTLGGVASGYTTAYTGAAITPAIVVKTSDNKTLTANTDYTVSYSNNTVPGTATATITGVSPNVTGTLTPSFTITKADLAAATISVSPAVEQYTGEVVQTPSVTVTLGGVDITSHCDISWNPATLQDEGNYKVTATAKSGDAYYEGSVAKKDAFSISTTPTWYADSVTGGTMTELGQERVYVWKTDSRAGTTGSITLPQNVIADILVVGGGGAGGASRGGGGGAGGMIYREGVKLAAGTYNITVGAGGLARLPGATGATAAYDGTYFATAAQDGGNSSISSASAALYTAFGGGAGQSYVDDNFSGKLPSGVTYTPYINNGRTGGSSGGSAGYNVDHSQNVSNTLCVVEGQGNVGGTGDRTELATTLKDSQKTAQGEEGPNKTPVSNNIAGGGGGAGAPGGDANLQLDVMASGNGGIGLLCDITGEAVYYAGGGGGGSYQDDQWMTYLGLDRKAGLGGEGGGGNGADSKHLTAEAGEPGTGGGGGGGSGYANSTANCIPGDGGSGIVVIRLKMADESTEIDDETEGEWVWKTNLAAGRWHKKGNWTPEDQGIGYPNGKLSTANFAPATDDVASYVVTAIDDVSVSNLVFRSGAAPTRINLDGNTLTAQNRLAVTNASVTFKNGTVDFKTLDWGDKATVTFDAATVSVANASAATAAGTPSAGEIVFQNGTTATWGDLGYAGSAANNTKVTVDGSTVSLGKFATNGDLPDALMVIGGGNLTLAQMTANHKNVLSVDGGSTIVTSGEMKPVSYAGEVSIGKGMVTGASLATGNGTIAITVPNEGYTADFLPFKLTGTASSSIANWQFKIDYSNWGSLSLLRSGAQTSVTVPLITGNSVITDRTFSDAFVNEPIGCVGSLEFSSDHKTLNLVVTKGSMTEYWWKATGSTISWNTGSQWMSSANYSTSRNAQPNSYDAIVYAYRDSTSTKGELNVTDGFKQIGIFTTGVRTGVATDEMLVKGNGNASANGIQYNRESTDGTIWRLNAGTTRVQSFGVKSVGSKAGYIDLQPQANLIAEGLVADSSTILRFTSNNGWNGKLTLTGTANTFGGFNGTSADAVIDVTSDNARTDFTKSSYASGDTGKLALKVTLGSNNGASDAVFDFAGKLKVAAGSTLAIDATGVSAGDYKIVKAASGSDLAALADAATVTLPTGSALQVRWITTATDLTLRLCYTAVKPVLTQASGYHTGSSQKSVVDPSSDAGEGYTYAWTGNWTDVGTHSVTATLNANTYWVGETGDAATAPITLTYEILANKINVTFDKNGGSGSMSPQEFTLNEAQALNANTFTRTGYTFAGWATSAGGSVVYTDGASATFTTAIDVTLYAKWTRSAYGITYDNLFNLADFATKEKALTCASHGSIAVDLDAGSITLTRNASSNKINISNSVCRVSSDFSKYYSIPVTVGKTYVLQFDVKRDTNEGLYRLDFCTYDNNGEVVSAKLNDTSYKDPNTGVKGETVEVTPVEVGGKIPTSIMIRFYAQRKSKDRDAYPNTITYSNIKFYEKADAVVASATPWGTTITSDATTYGELPSPTLTGATFSKWTTDKAGTGSAITSATELSPVASQALYSQWTVAEPTAISGLVYNGESQTGVENVPDLTIATKTAGDTSAINAGEYSATYTLTHEQLHWATETSTEKTVDWLIAKKKLTAADVESDIPISVYWDSKGHKPTFSGSAILGTDFEYGYGDGATSKPPTSWGTDATKTSVSTSYVYVHAKADSVNYTNPDSGYIYLGKLSIKRNTFYWDQASSGSWVNNNLATGWTNVANYASYPQTSDIAYIRKDGAVIDLGGGSRNVFDLYVQQNATLFSSSEIRTLNCYDEIALAEGKNLTISNVTLVGSTTSSSSTKYLNLKNGSTLTLAGTVTAKTRFGMHLRDQNGATVRFENGTHDINTITASYTLSPTRNSNAIVFDNAIVVGTNICYYADKTVTEKSVNVTSNMTSIALSFKLGALNTTASDPMVKLVGRMSLNEGSSISVDARGKAEGEYKLMDVATFYNYCINFASIVPQVDAGYRAELVAKVNGGNKDLGSVNKTGTKQTNFQLSLIIRKEIARPTAITGLVYNGAEQTGVADGTGYTLTVHKATNAGDYTATATLNDYYCWADDGSINYASINWSIAKKSITPTVTLSKTTATYGSSGWDTLPTVIVKDGSITLTEGDLTYTKSWSSDTVTGANTYTVTVSASDNGNYTFSQVEKTYTVSPASVTVPTAKTGLEYTGKSQSGINNIPDSSIAERTGDSSSKTGAGSYTTHYTLKDTTNYKWDDNTIEKKTVKWSISKVSLTVTPVLSATTIKLGEAAPTVTSLSYSGFVNGETQGTANSFTSPTSSTTYTPGAGAGTYTYTLSGGSARDYTFNLQTVSFMVESDTYTITVLGGEGGTAGAAESYESSSTSSQTKQVTTAPTRANYKVIGYTVEGANFTTGNSGTVTVTPEGVITLPKGVYGNLTLTPIWERKLVAFIFNSNGGKANANGDTFVDNARVIPLGAPMTYNANLYPDKSIYVKASSRISYADGGIATVNAMATVGEYGTLDMKPAAFLPNDFMAISGVNFRTVSEYLTNESGSITQIKPVEAKSSSNRQIQGDYINENIVAGSVYYLDATNVLATTGDYMLRTTIYYNNEANTTNTFRFSLYAGRPSAISATSFTYQPAFDGYIACDLPVTTRAGYTFKGWNTAADGSGTPVTAEMLAGTDVGSVDSATTLYAIWERTAYGITYDNLFNLADFATKENALNRAAYGSVAVDLGAGSITLTRNANSNQTEIHNYVCSSDNTSTYLKYYSIPVTVDKTYVLQFDVQRSTGEGKWKVDFYTYYTDANNNGYIVSSQLAATTAQAATAIATKKTIEVTPIEVNGKTPTSIMIRFFAQRKDNKSDANTNTITYSNIKFYEKADAVVASATPWGTTITSDATTYVVPSPNPTLEGASFTKWTLDKAGTGDAITSATTLPTPVTSKALWSQWNQVIAVPTANTLTYNGTEQTGVAEGTGYTLTGTTKATNAGPYTATVTPNAGYCWSDGSTGAQDVPWSIAKAPLTITLPGIEIAYGADPALVKAAIAQGATYSIPAASSEVTISAENVTINAGSEDTDPGYKDVDGQYAATSEVTPGETISQPDIRWCKRSRGFNVTYNTTPTSDNYDVTVQSSTLTLVPGHYIWKSEKTSGNWNDPENWTCVDLSKKSVDLSLGYPNCKNSCVVFTNANTTATVNVPANGGEGKDFVVFSFAVGRDQDFFNSSANPSGNVVIQGAGTVYATRYICVGKGSKLKICGTSNDRAALRSAPSFMDNEDVFAQANVKLYGTGARLEYEGVNERPMGAGWWLNGSSEGTLVFNECNIPKTPINNSWQYMFMQDMKATQNLHIYMTNSTIRTATAGNRALDDPEHPIGPGRNTSTVITNQDFDAIGPKGMLTLKDSQISFGAVYRGNFGGTFNLDNSTVEIYDTGTDAAVPTSINLSGANAALKSVGIITNDGPITIAYPLSGFTNGAPIEAASVALTAKTFFTIDATALTASGVYPIVKSTEAIACPNEAKLTTYLASISPMITITEHSGIVARLVANEDNEIDLVIEHRYRVFDADDVDATTVTLPDSVLQAIKVSVPTDSASMETAFAAVNTKNAKGVSPMEAYLMGFEAEDVPSVNPVLVQEGATLKLMNGSSAWPTAAALPDRTDLNYELKRAETPTSESWSQIGETGLKSTTPVFTLPDFDTETSATEPAKYYKVFMNITVEDDGVHVQ